MIKVPFLEDLILKWLRPKAFDDFINRLNYSITASIFAFFALIVSAKQYAGSPIQCWTPADFSKSWEQYAEDYCFVTSPYYIAKDENIPLKVEDRELRQIGYYQWVPLVLAIQSLMFFLPSLIWRTFSKMSNANFEALILNMSSLRTIISSERDTELTKIAEYLIENFNVSKCNNKLWQNCRLSLIYILTKILFVLNIITQFLFLNIFIRSDYYTFGIDVLRSILAGEGFNPTMFPRFSFCDMEVREIGNTHRYTLQCILIINMFNEKIYLFLWFWLAFIFVATCINLFYSLYILFISYARNSYVNTLIKAPKHPTMNCFPDIILLLRFIETNAGSNVTSDLLNKLYSLHIEKCVIRISENC